MVENLSHRFFTPAAPTAVCTTGAKGAPAMADFIAVLLGVGTILAMAAYAELCERI